MSTTGVRVQLGGPRLDGYIYLARSTLSGLYKVGSSVDPIKRVKTLQTADPTIELIDSYPTKNMVTIEWLVHRRLKPWHVRGEWFNLPDLVVQWLQALLAGVPEARHTFPTPPQLLLLR